MAQPDPPKSPYHHGDLYAALLIAAEAELGERGVEAFSLRQVARRAGVSHAAPAHHFRDANGLLTALAAEGFRRFLETQRQKELAAKPDPESQLMASGVGYVEFAMTRPALFRLMFGSGRPDYSHPDLRAAADAAYQHLTQLVTLNGGAELEIAAAWSVVHGVADLMVAGRLRGLKNLSTEDRDRAVTTMLARSQRA